MRPSLLPFLLLLACPEPGKDSGGPPTPLDLDRDGYTTEDGDCDDEDEAVSPGAVELCDNVDNNCNTQVDEGVLLQVYPDADGDGFGDAAAMATEVCEVSSGWVSDHTDCDDTDPDFHPAAAEADCADPNDYNCDGSVGYADADGDGFAACQDCDDDDGAVNADAVEACNGIDDDCDGGVDEAGAVGEAAWYADTDADGYGDPDQEQLACAAPVGFVADATDCDDSSDRWHPGADESDCADPNDYNCDGSVGYANADGDGFAACQDCDDADPAVNPDAAETCNGIDDDCDVAVDEAGAGGELTWHADADGDGFGDAGTVLVQCDAPVGYVLDDTDCDDADNTVFPGAPETCNGVDDDCDGSIDGVDEVAWADWYADGDGDGYGDAARATYACSQPAATVSDASDCDDADNTVFPGAPETCNGVDDDCDGSIDGVDEVSWSNWYADRDGDSYGDAATTVSACAQPGGYLADDTDCDDTDAGIHPGAAETCDGVDEDCDGTADAADEVSWSDWYADADGDSHGNAAAAVSSCGPPPGYLADATDCDDTDATVYPGAPETCDGQDEDCDGTADGTDEVSWSDWYDDGDGDSYGDPATAVSACSTVPGSVGVGGDCNDASADWHPGAPETDCADPNDYNCDGVVAYADADADTFAACEECDDTDAAVNPDAVETCNGVDDDCDGAIDNGAVDETAWYVDADGDGYGATGSTPVTACSAPAGYVDNDDDCDDTDAGSHTASSSSQTFTYTGGAQTFTVPGCVSQVTITAYGAAGGRGTSVGASVAGLGGMAQGTLSVTAGSALYVYVGGSGGYNGGGAAWSGSSQACNGGGASDVRVGGTAVTDRVIVAGGGGGVCGETSWGDGGDGGGGTCSGNYCGGEAGAGYYLTRGGTGGASGGTGVTGCHGGAGGGGGGTSGGGGAVSTCYGGATAGSGTLGSGGAGNCSTSGCCGPYGVAGGGGGYYGGGGAAGGCCGGGGAGGGSSWTGTLSSPSFAAGVRAGNGQVVVSW